MNGATSVAPKPHVVPIERTMNVSPSNGAHSSGVGTFRTVVLFEVWNGTNDQRLASCDTKAKAESFIEGWEAHRAHVRERMADI